MLRHGRPMVEDGSRDLQPAYAFDPPNGEEAEMSHETELAYREGSGVEVALLWNRGSNELTVRVADTGSGDCFEVVVDSASALDAFRHPYAYAARDGVSFLPPAPEPALSP
jgi:hypothetical protein